MWGAARRHVQVSPGGEACWCPAFRPLLQSLSYPTISRWVETQTSSPAPAGRLSVPELSATAQAGWIPVYLRYLLLPDEGPRVLVVFYKARNGWCEAACFIRDENKQEKLPPEFSSIRLSGCLSSSRTCCNSFLMSIVSLTWKHKNIKIKWGKRAFYLWLFFFLFELDWCTPSDIHLASIA